MADAVARARARKGRTTASDVQLTKAALWRRLFGADLSPELIAALSYVDVRERLVKLTSGGWVRDQGDKMFASGADPRVVAIMVEAAKAKGWRGVRIWGDEAFLREARHQFESAGIAVEVVNPPQVSKIEPVEAPPVAPPDTAEVLAQFRRWRANAEGRLADIRHPAAPSADLIAARTAEKETEDAWRHAVQREKAARQARNAARQDFEKAGFLSRKAARARLEAAQADLEALREALRDASGEHDDAKLQADNLQRDHDQAERQRRANRAGEERRAQAEVVFASECARIAAESLDIAVHGREAVEAEARAQLAARTTRDAADALFGVDAEVSSVVSPP
ncbi:type II secretory pathway pseudopilin PulG [Rhodoblastus acidophilus]|uniref:LPD7 domain-containing protein n=1 Tax=Rhodoblastus acidophilus TaxID=1074 RepID=UPI002224F40E|nr:LPD7 domain-containing protein [Rhodoblastus acidophilus]MCW2283161.1 type II secretory pathway pseudopilin PulG [Rhodoblastus acidophilus]MCW2332022.1 type II secretory pathway pseudopilin PulG [Rhodoblastus acidophilus]